MRIAGTGFTRLVSPATLPQRMLVRAVSIWNILRRRREIGRLTDLDDRQLLDIGISRHEVHEAIMFASFEDAGAHLTRSARRRADAYYRDARSS